MPRPSVPWEKYLEMDWRAPDKVAALRVLRVADQVLAERQYALILVEGDDKAFKCWNNLEEQVENPKDPQQVWDTFEQSFEQSTSYQHFHDVYLADFRQDPMESTADLDLCIRETV